MPFSIVWIWICELYVAVTGRQLNECECKCEYTHSLTRWLTDWLTRRAHVVPAFRTWIGRQSSTCCWSTSPHPHPHLLLLFCYRMQNYLAMLHVVNNFKIRFPQVWRKHERAGWGKSWRVRVLIAVDCNAPLKAALSTSTSQSQPSLTIVAQLHRRPMGTQLFDGFPVWSCRHPREKETERERRSNSHHALADLEASSSMHAMHMNYFCSSSVSSSSTCSPLPLPAPCSPFGKINVDANTCM